MSTWKPEPEPEPGSEPGSELGPSAGHQPQPQPLPQPQLPNDSNLPIADFRVTPERRREARRARLQIVTAAVMLLALAAVAWLVFPPGGDTRPTLSYAAVVLAILAVLLLLRMWLISRKAERFVSADGAMLRLDLHGILLAGDTQIPWHAVSGIWAFDSATELRARARHTVFGAPGRLMLRAGVNTANITFGVTDARAVADPRARLRRFRPTEAGLIPGRIELPFGSQFDTARLHEALDYARAILPADVAVRLADGVMDYAAAWSGTNDDIDTIRVREAQRGPRPADDR